MEDHLGEPSLNTSIITLKPLNSSVVMFEGFERGPHDDAERRESLEQLYAHTEKYFRNLIKSNYNLILV